MLKLRTVYPYGFNDRIDNEWKKEDTHDAVAKRFPKLKRKFVRSSRGKTRYGVNNLDPKSFCTKLRDISQNNISDTANFIRLSLSSIKKKYLKNIYFMLESKLSNSSNINYSQWYLMALDLIESKLSKHVKETKKKQRPENICSVYFHNKGVL